MSEMGLLAPRTVWWLGALVPLAVWLVARERRRRADLVRYNLASPPTRRAILGPLLVSALAVVALARPHLGFEEVRLAGAGRDVFFAVDVSKSMLADDVSPHRLGVAKRKVSDLIERIASTSPGDRIGIVLFAGEAYLFCPLTADYTVVRAFANAISTDLISTGGSALTEALEIVVRSVDETKAKYPRVIVMSDGEETELDAERIGAALARRNVTVYPLAIGSSAGRPIPLPQGGFMRDSRGDIVISRLNLDALEVIAERTGGQVVRPTVNDADVATLLGGASPGAPREGGGRTVRTYREVGPVVALVVLGILLSCFAVRRLRPVVWALLVGFVSSPGQVHAGPFDTDTPFTAARRYSAGDYGEAISILEREVARTGGTWALHQALGAALYRRGDHERAVAEFGRAAERAANGRERFESLYNRGNAHFRRGNYGEAITDYDGALRLKPGDEDATFNRALAERFLTAEPPPPPPPPKEEPQAQDGEAKSGEHKGESGAPSSSSDTQDKGDTGDPSAGGEEAEAGGGETPDGEGGTPPSRAPDGAPEGSPTPGPSGEAPEATQPEGGQAGGEARADSARDGGPTEDPKSWLQSLGESPVLLERRGGRSRQAGGQSW